MPCWGDVAGSLLVERRGRVTMVWRWQLRGRGHAVAWRWFGGCEVVLAPWRDWCAGRRGGSGTIMAATVSVWRESGGGSRGWQYCAILQQLNCSGGVGMAGSRGGSPTHEDGMMRRCPAMVWQSQGLARCVEGPATAGLVTRQASVVVEWLGCGVAAVSVWRMRLWSSLMDWSAGAGMEVASRKKVNQLHVTHLPTPQIKPTPATLVTVPTPLPQPPRPQLQLPHPATTLCNTMAATTTTLMVMKMGLMSLTPQASQSPLPPFATCKPVAATSTLHHAEVRHHHHPVWCARHVMTPPAVW
ncbi:hypothetical protein EDB89DRAFT_1909478 [Lactarius sanguifluus]|nr:hypothetical protein EDB89DRAFT_1909478 [Lactarius sanguifluus]